MKWFGWVPLDRDMSLSKLKLWMILKGRELWSNAVHGVTELGYKQLLNSKESKSQLFLYIVEGNGVSMRIRSILTKHHIAIYKCIKQMPCTPHTCPMS